MKVIKKNTDSEVYYIVSKNNQTEFIRPYHDYYGSWTSDISEAEHKYLRDAFSIIKQHKDYEVLKVTEIFDKYDIEKISKDSSEVKQELFEEFLDICLTYKMEHTDNEFKDSYTGIEYPKKWISVFYDIKQYAKTKLKELAKSEGIDYE